MRAASRQMAQLIDALLALSHVARADLARSAVDLSAVARSVLAALATSEPDRQVDLAIAHGLVAEADQGLARILLDNLLGNAWRYTGRKDRARIEFGVTDSLSRPEFYVRDSGAGFDMRYAGKLFQPFQRLHRVDEFDGTGIGLAIVQRVVRRHRGTIRAEAAEGKGATFYFTLSA